MLVFKIIYRCCFFCILVFICQCKGPTYSTSPLQNFPHRLWGNAENIGALYGGRETDSILKIDVYQSVMKEILVENPNHVSEYQLVDSLSDKVGLNIAVSRFRYTLDFYVFHLKGKAGPDFYRGVLSTTGHYGKNRPFSLGPVYMGEITADKDRNTYSLFHARRKLKFSNDYTFRPIKGKPGQANMRFYTTATLRPSGSLPFEPAPMFRIERIIEGEENKISGAGKMLVFDIAELFDDKQALQFRYVETLVPPFPDLVAKREIQ